MKKRNLFYMAFSLLLVVSMSFMISCVKEGPQGIAGKDGKDGINGSDGTDGVDGNVVCLQCHNLVNKAAKEEQYALSLHATGTAYIVEGGRQSCAMCHSHEGFVETQWTGHDTLNEKDNVKYPHSTTITCATCHDFHSTFDFDKEGADYALRTSGPVDMLMYRTAKQPAQSIDFKGTSNLCVNCHQPRSIPPFADGSGNYAVTSTRLGPHYGAMATTVAGKGAYEIAGTIAYPVKETSSHFKDASCVECHMGTFDNGTGGHSFKPSLLSCKKCHTTATSFDINSTQTNFDLAIAALKLALEAKGILNADLSGNAVKGTYPADLAGAAYNWKWLTVDGRDRKSVV